MADARFRDRYVEGLMERVRREAYPSVAHLDLVESLVPPQEMDTYLEILLDKIEGERYPSISMLNRVQRIVAQLPQAQNA